MVIKVVNSSLSPTTSLEGVSRYFRPISSLEEQENRPMRPKSGPLTPLHDAVMDCDEEKVKRLIRSRPEWLNRGDVLGRTPLLHACYWGRSERILKLLLDGGANPFVVDVSGITPLTLAAAVGHEHLCKHLHKPKAYEIFFLDYKLLSHLFDIYALVSWKGLFFSLEGFWHPLFAALLSKGIKEYVACNAGLSLISSQEVSQELHEILFFMKDPVLNHSLFTMSLKESSFYVLPTGWKGHQIVLLFWRSYLFLCDPSAFGGEETVVPCKIDWKLCTQELLDEMQDLWTRADKKSGVNFFFHQLPDLLKGKECEPTQEELNFFRALRIYAPKPIESGICSFGSQLVALYVAVAVMQLKKRPKASFITTVSGAAREIEKLHAFLQAQCLFGFLGRHLKDPELKLRPVQTAFRIIRRRMPLLFPLRALRFPLDQGMILGDEMLRRLSSLMHRVEGFKHRHWSKERRPLGLR